MSTVFPSALSTIQKQLKSVAHPAIPAFSGLPVATITRAQGQTAQEFCQACIDAFGITGVGGTAEERRYESLTRDGRQYRFVSFPMPDGAPPLPPADEYYVVPMIQGPPQSDGSRIVTILAQPAYSAKAASTTVSSSATWDSGARSIDTVGEYGFFEFSIDTANDKFDRAFIGLVAADSTPADNVAITDAEYGFYLRADDPDNGSFRSRIQHNGNDISGAASKLTTSISADVRYRIFKTPTAVTFSCLDPATGDVLFEYTPAGYAITGEVRLDVALYRSLDAVTMPVCVTPENNPDVWEEMFGAGAEVANFEATLSPVQVYIGEAADFFRVVVPVEPVEIAIAVEPYGYVAQNLPAVHVYLGPSSFFRVIAETPAVEIEQISWHTDPEREKTFTIGDDVDIYMPMRGAHRSAMTASWTCVPSPVDIEVFFRVEMDLRNRVTYAPLSGVSLAFSVSTVFESGAVNTISTSLDTSFNVTYQIERDITVSLGTLEVSSGKTLFGTIDRLALDPQYVLHTQTSAPWEYAELVFTDMVTTEDGSVFMLDPELGILALNGPDGAELTQPEDELFYLADFGGSDYDVATRKNLDSVWLGMEYTGTFETPGEAVGDVFVSTEVSSEYTYPVISTPPQSRAVCGRGLYGRTIRVRYQWTTTREFMIDSLEVSINTGQNRRVP